MESPSSLRLVLCCLAVVVGLTDAGQICGSCSLIVEPSDCNVVTECGDHEECLIHEYLTPAGLKRYDIGCESSFRCHGIGKRSQESTLNLTKETKSLDNRITLCKSCCNSTKMCNTIDGHCNSKTLNTYGALICYNCEQMEQPDKCDRIKLCGVDNQCYIGRKQNDLSGMLLWESRCGENSTECKSLAMTNAALAAAIGKRQLGNLCSSCCNHDRLCNSECAAPTIGPIQQTPAPTNPPTPPPTQKTTVQAQSPQTHAPAHQTQNPVTHAPAHHTHNPVTNAPAHNTHSPVTNAPAHHTHSPVTQTPAHHTHSPVTQTPAHHTHSPVTNAPAHHTHSPVTQTPAHHTHSPVTHAPLSKPVITFVTRPHDVKKGSYQHLICRANGNPKPTITWNFYALGNIKPTNVRVGNNGSEIYIDSVNDNNYGHYACKAKNSEGEDTRYVDILEHGPSGP